MDEESLNANVFSLSDEQREQLKRLRSCKHVPVPHTFQLIILGNGFDLACGLPSRYSDFFDIFFSDLMGIEPEGGYTVEDRGQILRKLPHLGRFGADADELPSVTEPGAEHEDRYSVWDYIFAYECHRDRLHEWRDVEAVVLEWVMNKDRLNVVYEAAQKNHEDFRRSVAGLSTVARVFRNSYERKNPRNPTEEDLLILEDVAGYMSLHGYESDRPGHMEGIRHMLLLELTKFESKFVEYLQTVIDGRYKSLALELYTVLSIQDIQSVKGVPVGLGDLSDSVVSFNYTQPFSGLNDAISKSLHTYRNVHGNLNERRIIFGIDNAPEGEENLLNDTSAMSFTKTYQILKDAHPSPRKLFHRTVDMSDNLDVIKIFGHSLGDADYSYFQAIFDEVNLYESNVVVIFYYRPYTGFDLERYYQSVVRIMGRYAESLDNKAHSKNLIHKLILEGRLSVNLLSPETVLSEALNE